MNSKLLQPGTEIAQYRIENFIGAGTRGQVYKVTRENQVFALKILPDLDLAQTEQSILFHRETAFAARINHPSIVRIFDFGREKDLHFIAMEYVEGRTLDEKLKQGPLGLDLTFKLARNLTEALNELHNLGMIHRDLTPENIMISSNHEIKLIDFGLAGAMDEISETGTLVETVGTFQYASPEQLGVVRRVIDGRSDLYSLGAVLFQCLTGALPFESSNLHDLMYHLMHRKARSVRDLNSNVSIPLDRMIAKLLEADPERRYHSAFGLIYDLTHWEKIESQYLTTKEIQIGSQDLPGNSQQRLRLFGRETEMRILRDHLNQSIGGTGCSVLLEGDGGLGKSRLATELKNEARAQRIPILKGKCSSQEISLPFGVIRQIIDQYLARIQYLPETDKEAHLAKIRLAAKDSPAVMATLSASLKNILGVHQPSASQMDPDLFRRCIRDFFCNLSLLHQGLVLFVDDIQWMDRSSVEVFRLIHDDMTKCHLFILMTARNDASSIEALNYFVGRMSSPRLKRIEIKPLTFAATTDICKAFLGGREVTATIAEKLFTISAGNPFVLIENLGSLVASGYMRFWNGQWHLDDQDLSKLGLSQNVLDLVTERIKRLPSEIQNILRIASVAGPSFHAAFLAKVLNQNENTIRDALAVAIRANILDRQEDSTYQFIHDRIREALLNGMNPQILQDSYDRMAQALGQEKELTADQVFNLARYAHLGHRDQHPQLVFQSNVAAGRLAIESNAYEQAHPFFQVACEFEARAQVSAEESVQFLMDHALTLAEIGHLEEANQILGEAQSKVQDKFQKLEILFLKATFVMQDGRVEESWDLYIQILKKCGHRFSKSNWLAAGILLFGIVQNLILTLRLAWWPPHISPEKMRVLKLCSRIYQNLSIFGNYLQKRKEMLLIASHWFYSTRQMGLGVDLQRSHSFLSVIYATLKMRSGMKYHLERVEKLSETINDPYARLLSQLTTAIVFERWGDDALAESKYVEAMPRLERYLGSFDFAIAWGSLAMFYFGRGHNQESLSLIHRNLPRTDASRRRTTSTNYRFISYLQLLILGHREEAEKVRNFLLESKSKFSPDFRLIGCQYPGMRLVEMYETGQISSTDADAAIEELKNYRFSFIYTDIYLVYIGYIRQWQCERPSLKDGNRQQALQRFEAELPHLDEMLKYSFCRAHYYIQMAALCRLKGEFTEAQIHLMHAESLAQVSIADFAHFMLIQERARLAKAQGRRTEFTLMARLAYEMASNKKWPLRMERVKNEFQLVTPPVVAMGDSSGTNLASASTQSLDDRVSNTLLRISLAASFEMDPQKQIIFSLNEIVTVMSAERSYVFLWDEHSQSLRFAGGRDNQMHELQEPTGYSSTVVKKVAASRTPLIVMGNDQMEALGSQSAVLHGLRSIIAAPLLLKGELKGVVYVDSSVSKSLFSKVDADLLAAIASHIAISFENLRMMNIEASRREMQKDLELSATIQKMLFPKEKELHFDGLRIAGFNRPAIQCGGDWWWYEMVDEKKFRLFVCDVTGHGAGPAMITSYIAACFKFRQSETKNLSLPDLIETISGLLLNLTESEYLVSSIALEIDLEKKTLQCWNSGSPGAYILRKDGGTETIGGMGSLLGTPNFEVSKVETELRSGDRIFIPTDGLMELLLPDGSNFGIRRTLKVMDKTRDMNVQEGLQYLVSQLDEMRGQEPQDDDITTIYLEID